MTYATKVLDLARQVAESQAEPVSRAAALFVTSIRAGGVVNAFGSGHSEAIAMEIAGRAGGLVPSNRLSPRDLVLYGGQPPSVLTPSWSATRRSRGRSTTWRRSRPRTCSCSCRAPA
ncbi:SIS domain-containing protein [Nonomuraea thailandensis]